MEPHQINASLNRLIGHIRIENSADRRKFEQLSRSLSEALVEEGPSNQQRQPFIYERSDIFSEEVIGEAHKERIRAVVNNQVNLAEPKYKVYRREVPVREPLLHSSVAGWATGSKVDHSVGPFVNEDGRQFWYDFFKIETMAALYMQGKSDPVLLFGISRQVPVSRTVPEILLPQRVYSLTKGSIWINSRILAEDAPAGAYTGLTLKGGRITISTVPHLINNKLTVPAGATIKVGLELEQPDPEPASENSPYGKDARNMQIQLPEALEFQFTAASRDVLSAGRAFWNIYRQRIRFSPITSQKPKYDVRVQRIILPTETSEQKIVIGNNESDFHSVQKEADIIASGWALPVAFINIAEPTPAAGIGELFVEGDKGLTSNWAGLKGGRFSLSRPVILAGPGQILIAGLPAGNAHASQELKLWNNGENGTGSSVTLNFSGNVPFFYLSNSNGNELLMTFCNASFKADRPVKVDGKPPLVRTLNSLLMIAAGPSFRLIYLYDDNLIHDDVQLSNQDPFIPKQMAFALTNALFKVTQPNGCLLFGSLDEAFGTVDKGFLFLTFGLLAYVPTLPDPYAANLGIMQRQIRGSVGGAVVTDAVGAAGQQVSGYLVCRVAWAVPPGEGSVNPVVVVSFHFAPLNNQFGGISLEFPEAEEPAEPEPATPPDTVVSPVFQPAGRGFLTETDVSVSRFETLNLSSIHTRSLHNITAAGTTHTTSGTPSSAPPGSSSGATHDRPLSDYGPLWDKESFRYKRDLFALLDVSTNADLFGISFDLLVRRDFRISHTTDSVTGEVISSFFPVQVEGMDVVSTGANVKAFTVPLISWEPVFNLTLPQNPMSGDPPAGFNYYPDDGGPAHILNNSFEKVVLAPLPVTGFLVNKRETDSNFNAYSFFTLPFGMKAVALLKQQYVFQNVPRDGGDLNKLDVHFADDMKAGLQLRMDAGIPLREGDSKMFMGSTVQINNILNLAGNPTGSGTLGGSVSSIFNREFFNDTNYPFELFKQRGVPVTRMDLSGYGASMFSNWMNTNAAIAETSQAKFDVMVGRCSHEIIQVKSIMYPWAIKVVRTITLFRVGSGYVYRYDSGWRAESDGKFDFRYFIYEPNPNFPGGPPENPEPQLRAVERFAELDIHPGIIKALYNVSNIVETSEVEPFTANVEFKQSADQNGLEILTPANYDIELQPVFFDADIEIDGVVSGMVSKPTSDGQKEVVASKKILGFVQLSPRGFPLNKPALGLLVTRQGTIGGPVDCEVDVAESSQKMRLCYFDFNNSFNDDGTDPAFCVAGRGNVLLPKDGSWTLVRHERANGDVSPVPENLNVPVIRKGKIVKNGSTVKVDTPVASVLTRIAEPIELLRQPAANTINYGFLQNTDTQKALFLTPSFKRNVKKLLSKTPPLFVDAFRIVNSKAIFPNIGEAENFLADTVGEAILMKKNGSIPFAVSDLQDLGQDVFELMDIQDTLNNVKEQGLKLLHNPETFFDLPSEFVLIDLGDGNFRIYIEYDRKDKNGNVEVPGSLDFDIDSVASSWKSKMNNIGLVIDLAGISRLMTIRGNWDSGNGKETTYPKPDLTFSPELQPLIDLLEILQSLQDGNYGEAVQNGLKLAMSNKAGTWEYKFEASKEIPVLRFPVPDFIYNDPNTPFKLEAGLRLGAYFNAALKVTTDANELLPSAGGFLGFYARLSVMCVSISAATIYAIGQANVDIAADTKLGPSLRMKFGFGAQIVVGLPVAGNVSVLYVVGAEIFIASGTIEVSAFLLFEGHAEILGGIVSITIRIEAKGTYSKIALGGGESRTDLRCQVTFGLDISIAFIINISFTESWQEQRRIA